jgi:hypothetical protein
MTESLKTALKTARLAADAEVHRSHGSSVSISLDLRRD